jgi:hypothetical protein
MAATVQDTRVNLLHVLEDDEERGVDSAASSRAASPSSSADKPAFFAQLSELVTAADFSRRCVLNFCVHCTICKFSVILSNVIPQ